MKRVFGLVVLGALALGASGCIAGLIQGYIIGRFDMGDLDDRSRLVRSFNAREIRTVAVINPFRLSGRNDFTCAVRDAQYIASIFDKAGGARFVDTQLPQGLSDETVRRSLAIWDDETLRRNLNSVVTPDAFLFGSVEERDFDLVAMNGYKSTVTFHLTLYDRHGRELWTASHKRRDFTWRAQENAAEALVAAYQKDTGLAGALSRR